MARKFYDKRNPRPEKTKAEEVCKHTLVKIAENTVVITENATGNAQEYDISRVAEEMLNFVVGLPVGGHGTRVQQAAVIAPLPLRR